MTLRYSTSFSCKGQLTMRPKTRAGRYARLKEPLVRDGGGLRPASWDEALDRAATNAFQHVVEEDRMRLAGVRTPQKNDVGLFHLTI